MDPGLRRDDSIRRRRSNVNRRQGGYLLLPVAVAIALIGVIAFLISSESAIEVELTTGELQAARAEYVAQAGLQHALREHAQQGCGPYTDLINIAFGVDQYDTKLTHDLGGTTAYTVNVDQDTWIRDDFPTNNYAIDTRMHIRNEAGVIERPLLRYDLSGIPAKAAILSARAWFYVNKEHSEGPVDIHLITSDWTDIDATWDSMGDKIDSRIVVSIPTEAGNGVWVSVNLTAQVQAWINGADNYGITINTESAGVHSEYLSSESAFPPYLEVVVGNSPTSPAKLSSTSKIAGGGAASVKRNLALVQSPAGYFHLQPDDTDGKDSWVTADKVTWNYGGADFLRVRAGGGGHWRSLLEFELEALPRGAHIVSAEMEIYRRYNNQEAPGTIEVYPVTQSWIEGDSSGGANPGVTFDYRDTALPWNSSGGDYASTPMTSFDVTAATDTWYSVDVKSLVRYWAAGNTNHGLILVAGDNNVLAEFIPSEHVDPTLRPKLSVTYSCECGTVCVAPQGSGNLLMVVVNPTVLVDEDQQAKNLFESWGYTVNVISESANQATYDSGFATNDVVFVSETVNSNTLGAKLVNAPIGVVSQDGDYNPDLGLASGNGLKVGAAIDIVSNDHYITRPFAAGALQIYAASMEQAVVSGAITADQQVLAEIGGDGSLVALDKGAAMEGGGTAAARRVILPLGTRYRFNWDHLNANGRLLVQRALEWGMSKDKKIVGNVLLVVANPGSLTAQEQAKQALIESWGYVVSLIDDNDSQANFDAAIALNDVAYIPQDITSSNLGTKLRNAAIGVVNEEGEQVDELGFSNSKLFKSRHEIDVVDNTHYITQPFSTGLLQFVSSDQSVHMLSGGIAPGLQTLGQSFNTGSIWEPSLATLDPGDELSGGGPAAGRRVELPWGGGTFDINLLTDDGRTIMQRALEWGAGAEAPDFSTELLFVVADPSALTGAESAKKSLIESWGYTVNLIDDADNVADFATAFGVNGVVYVSGEVSDSAIGSKLIKAGVGIVNEQISLHDELLLSTSAGTNDFNRVFVIDNTHYITEGINTGWHTIASTNQPLNALEGTLAPGMTNLAEVWISGANYDFGLAVVDTGGQLNGGEVAAGRRAQLPWGTASFDFSALNANGQNLMRRAIEWAGGAEIDLSPVAHWKLDETSGPTAVDSEGDNDGTWTNGPAAAPGVDAGGLDFDGSNDYVDVGTFDVVGSGITMMGWFNAEALTTEDERIISKAAGTAEADAWWQLSSSNSGADRFLRMRIKAGGTTTTMADSSVSLSIGTWYLAAATYDNTSGTMRLYLDGVEVASGAHAVGGALDVDPSVPVAVGANGTTQRFFNGVLDDVRIYNRALGADEIADLYSASAPQGPGYYELHQPWSATVADTWETVDLAPFGVPGDAVVEVAILNADAGKEQWGGARAVGSALDRRFLLHEAEAGGVDAVTLHVQADSSGQIQHYSSKTGDVTFVLLGFWIGAEYVELFDSFTANDDGVWINENVGSMGLGPGQVAEIVLQNSDNSAERMAGLRAVGSSINRRFDLHKAEAGGIDAVSLMVETDASSRVKVYAEVVSDIDYSVVGYWSVPPGSFTELGGTSARSTPTAAWGLKDVSPLGVPPGSVTQFVITNDTLNAERTVGARAVGSSQDRFVQLQEAEGGGSDLVTMHANVDANTNVEWYSESGTSAVFFYPVGAWVIAP